MPKKKFQSTPENIARRIAEGYGQGTGADYRPWLGIQDFPSKGVVHRPLGLTTGRVHQLFSDLEFKGFLICDITECIIDIREQFPLLPLEETLEIADKLQVRHPRDPATRYPVVMTTDLLLKVKLDREIFFNARTAKCEKDLLQQRVRDYFKIEHYYWLKRGIDWGFFSEKDIPKIVLNNATLIHPFSRLSDLHPLSSKEVNSLASYLEKRVSRNDVTLEEIVHDADQKFTLAPGKSFSVVCHLIANNIWKADLHKPIALKEKLALIKPPSGATP
jgi:hypothetical protein